MNDTSEHYELWGTFSVMDHLREGAFLAEVILYDRLVIPVPPDPAPAQTPEDLAFAEKQQDRWNRHGWNPERQQKLLKILTAEDLEKPVAVPVEWNRQRHQEWASEYEKSKLEAAQQFSEILAGWKTGEVLLQELPAMAAGVVAVSPFTSLEDLKRECGITETSPPAERLQAGRGLPGDLLSAVLGHEFLVPEDPDRDEFYLLREAVDLVQDTDYREARQAFHNAQQRFIKNGQTDLESVTAAVNAVAEHLEALQKIARRRRILNGLRRAFLFAQIVADPIGAPINALAAGKAAIALGKFTVDERLGNPAAPNTVRPGGALLLDAQQHLKLTLD
ncbi:hypothetical protein Lepto7375DRAFT_3747 [Leptolyngbya sp. PCC 7375]|nr:hypothetical protein Lepto7375DRAFT_3747 [Leptolyngbya sp. PCC 7375]